MRRFALTLGLRLFFVMMGFVACGQSSPPVLESTSNSPTAHKQDQSKFQKIGDVPEATGWRSIQFINDNEGWLGGSEKLWRTTNGGRDWELVYSADSYEGHIWSVQFVDAREGFMHRFNGLYKTEDGGRTWINGPPTPFDGGKGDLSLLKFREGGRVGWAGGGIFRPISQKELKGGVPNNTFNSATKEVLDGALFRTDDGGLSWKRQPVSLRADRFFDLYFIDERRLLVLGSRGVFYSENQGGRWMPVKFRSECVGQRYLEEYEGRPLSAYFVDSKVGWVSFDDGRIVKSTDGGLSWCDLVPSGAIEFALPFDKYLRKIHFSDPTHGWGLGGDGFLYKSADGGAKWQRVETDFKIDDMYFLDRNHGWFISKIGLFRIGS